MFGPKRQVVAGGWRKVRQILLGWWNQRSCDGRGMQHAMGKILLGSSRHI